MRVAVIGRGTAGLIAAVRISKDCPELELTHIYDPRIPPIGVGEGTLPGFVAWIRYYSGQLSEKDFQERCGVTRKYGIEFEGWGASGTHFTHNFYPIDETFSYHISADNLGEIILDQIQAKETILKRVTQVETTTETATVHLADEEQRCFDFVIDARGFPKEEDDDIVQLDCLSTNAAVVQTGPAVKNQRMTRSVARPYGWVFIIPLQNRTSYGYVYNAKLNDPEEITADLRAMMEAEGAPPIGSPKHLRFPNFVRKRALEGRIFRFGNSFSFIEPLEATAIGLHTVNIAQALHFPMGRWTKRFQRLPFTSSYEKNKLVKDVQLLNRWLFRESLRASVFVAWHYSQGSKYQTPFWKNAKRAFEEGATTFPEPDLWAEMMDYIEAAKDFSSVEQFVQRMKADSGHPFSPFVDKPRKYCQWHLPSFIELFHGLGG